MLLTPSFSRTQIFYSILTLTFSFLGFLFYFSADKLRSHVIDYGELCETQGRSCELTFSPETDLYNPHVYYELDKFYSNQRMLATSKSLYDQLRGVEIDINEKNCQGVQTIADLRPDLSVYQKLTDLDLSSLPPDTPLNPCGILPKYIFTDSFNLSAENGDLVPIDETRIASAYDRDVKFKKAEDGQLQWLDVTNEHFIVWDQMDTLNTVFRLYGRIDDNLKQDEVYTLNIDNSYDKSIFGGRKRLYFQEVNQLGGPNKLLGVLFICTAATLVLIQVVFLVLYVAKIANHAGGVADFYNPDNLSF